MAHHFAKTDILSMEPDIALCDNRPQIMLVKAVKLHLGLRSKRGKGLSDLALICWRETGLIQLLERLLYSLLIWEFSSLANHSTKETGMQLPEKIILCPQTVGHHPAGGYKKYKRNKSEW